MIRITRDENENLRDVTCEECDTIINVMRKMSVKHKLYCCVLKSGRLFGFVNDSDIRRAIVKGVSLDSPIGTIANRNPIKAEVGVSENQLKSLYRKEKKDIVPIVDKNGCLLDVVEHRPFLSGIKKRNNRVFFIIGGEGRRLLPLTVDKPKPMVTIFGKPMLEMIIEKVRECGFSNFVFCVNYLSEQIEEYFGNGKRWRVSIEYVHETTKLGTVGALSLYTKKVTQPILILNGDLLTNLDFGSMIDFHLKEKSLMTLCIVKHEIKIPYGVVDVNGNKFNKIIEKPTYDYFINAGIYVLDPDIIKEIPSKKAFNMTDLISVLQSCEKKRDRINCFPIFEYWKDVGTIKDYQEANSIYYQSW